VVATVIKNNFFGVSICCFVVEKKKLRIKKKRESKKRLHKTLNYLNKKAKNQIPIQDTINYNFLAVTLFQRLDGVEG